MTDDTDPLVTSSDGATPDDGPYSALKAFLVGRGVARHKQTAEVAGLLGLAKTSVFRKFKGESSFSLPELKVIADHFGTDVDTLRGVAAGTSDRAGRTGVFEPASLHIAGLPAQGQLQPGPLLAPDDVCDLVAIQRDGKWHVFPTGSTERSGEPAHAVAALQVTAMPRQRIALLEDDANAAAIVAMALQSEGMVVHTFRDAASLVTAVSQRPYQGYVMDWLLGNGTAESAIRQVRSRQPRAPIAITTGALHTGAETEGTLIPFAEEFTVGIFEKPFRQAVLASYLRRGMAANR